MDYRKIFDSLPNVNSIWETSDGHFHLHPHYGGEEITRESIDELDADSDSDSDSEPKKRGRKPKEDK